MNQHGANHIPMPSHILTVDDDDRIRRLVQLNLERAGYRVSMATDGVEALAAVEQDRPDLILLDVSMPHMDGIETLRRLKANPATAAVPVVMLTARAQDEDVAEKPIVALEVGTTNVPQGVHVHLPAQKNVANLFADDTGGRLLLTNPADGTTFSAP